MQGQAPSPVEVTAPARAVHLPFFEAYFSNFIEGTVLTLDEAEDVIYHDQVLPTHPEDAHDVAATFQLVADPDEARRVPASADDLIALLIRRHAILMAARTDKYPGEFKGVQNPVGNYVFVHHDQVEGTLQAGWDALDQLDDPFQRAVAMMYVVTEVHPFDDGNGRVARLMMNAELSAAGESRLIIPPVYRAEYLASLSTMSNNDRPDALHRVLGFAQRWTAQIDFSTLQIAVRDLEATNAFVDRVIADADAVKLRLISSVPAYELEQAAEPGP